jgi:crossover junction endodeoxyribonuclease RusA
MIVINVYPPDARKRDLDNLLKCLLDSLQTAKVYEDDSQIDYLLIKREKQKLAKLEINIESITNDNN